jgi:hypothetical protein
MPIDRLDRTSLAGVERLAETSGPLASLLVRKRIDIFKYALGLQVRIFFITLVSEEKSLPAVTYKDKGIVRNLEFSHCATPKSVDRGRN